MRHALYVVGYGNVSKMGPMIAVGSAKTQGSKAKPIGQVRAAQSNHSEGRSDTKEGQHFGAPGYPIKGTCPPQASYLSLDPEVSFMPLCVGWHLAIRVFFTDYPRKKHETTWSRFDRGALAPV
jgi:hypothetical protein